ncbi:hypothetical protein [Listeria booriae]|uniref:hypothetical protein n=1 Tax=Listeria booriae TaxID=1552123 RepID=UPI0016296A4A|nr:hypothetical protein [Listeria booriae]MBC1233671.1 hypothetical protein [Listeria booriae]MBC2188687.1 hypothetical protein [Listeria booriae]
MDEELEKQLDDMVETAEKSMPNWNSYNEGYLDGLDRAIGVIKRFYAKEEVSE